MKALGDHPRIGTAGWAIPVALRPQFGKGSSNLASYATLLNCVEINSSFNRRHRADTWVRWAASVPSEFRFSAKVPKAITHTNRLVECEAMLEEFVADTHGMGRKLEVLLVQLPPSLQFDEGIASNFARAILRLTSRSIVFEPRHSSWFGDEREQWFREHGITRAGADPSLIPDAAHPGGASTLKYWRLHGSPRMYRSSYDMERLAVYASALAAAGSTAWCIFDNTAASAATANALELAALSRNGSAHPTVADKNGLSPELPPASRSILRSAPR